LFKKNLITDTEKADAIASKFAESHNSTIISSLSIMVRASCSVLEGGGFNTDASTYTFPREIKGVIGNLRGNKTPGDNAFNNFLLKNLSHRKALIQFTCLFKGCLKLSYFPTKRKQTNVIPIQNPNKDLSNPSNFRPYSLLSAVSNLFEKVILKRFNKFLTTSLVFAITKIT
jgi:hypothetical protein